jgi:hypothetical protein
VRRADSARCPHVVKASKTADSLAQALALAAEGFGAPLEILFRAAVRAGGCTVEGLAGRGTAAAAR